MELRYFKPQEFACKCGQCGLGVKDMNPGTLQKLDHSRHTAGTPFVITSAIRCVDHNIRVGGVDDSSHVQGVAIDIAVKSSHARFRILKALLDGGFRRIGVYKTFIHADDDERLPQEVCWNNT